LGRHEASLFLLTATKETKVRLRKAKISKGTAEQPGLSGANTDYLLSPSVLKYVSKGSAILLNPLISGGVNNTESDKMSLSLRAAPGSAIARRKCYACLKCPSLTPQQNS